MAGSLTWRVTADCHGKEAALYVGEHDVDALESADKKATWTLALERFERAHAEVKARTGSQLPVFAAYAPSETRWGGLNMGKAYALINIGYLKTVKEYKWIIVHELAHQRGVGHNVEFNREFEVLAFLMDPAEEEED